MERSSTRAGAVARTEPQNTSPHDVHDDDISVIIPIPKEKVFANCKKTHFAIRSRKSSWFVEVLEVRAANI